MSQRDRRERARRTRLGAVCENAVARDFVSTERRKGKGSINSFLVSIGLLGQSKSRRRAGEERAKNLCPISLAFALRASQFARREGSTRLERLNQAHDPMQILSALGNYRLVLEAVPWQGEHFPRTAGRVFESSGPSFASARLVITISGSVASETATGGWATCASCSPSSALRVARAKRNESSRIANAREGAEGPGLAD